MNHFDADVCDDGEETFTLAMSGTYDCIVLGTVSSRLNSYAVVRKLRQSKNVTPVLMMTSHDNYKERVKGLESGADYCLSKPLQTAELMACVRALYGRKLSVLWEDTLTFGDLKLNLSTCELACGANKETLSQREFSIMTMLLKSSSVFVTKEQIRTHVWGFRSEVSDNNIEAYVSILRKRCKALNSNVRIVAKRLQGYRLRMKDEPTEAERS